MSEKSNWKPCGGGWSVDLSQQAALHENGFRLDFSGHPSSRNFDVQPSGLPSHIGAVQWAGLLREGTDEYRRAYAREDTSAIEDDEDEPGDQIGNTFETRAGSRKRTDASVHRSRPMRPDHGTPAESPLQNPESDVSRKPVITVKRKRQIG